MTAEWEDGYSVGVARFDENHKKLCAMINELSAGVLQGNKKDMQASNLQRSVLKALLEYTTNHFGDEEHLMKEYGYPDMAPHENEHEEFRGRLSGFVDTYMGDSALLTTDILDYLLGWLVKHINGTDKKYQAFFNSKGVS